MAFQYGPDGVIITPNGNIGTGYYGHVQGQLGEANDADTIAAQVAAMNQTSRELQSQGKPNLGQSGRDAAAYQPPAPVVPQQVWYATNQEKLRQGSTLGGNAGLNPGVDGMFDMPGMDGLLGSDAPGGVNPGLKIDPKTGLPEVGTPSISVTEDSAADKSVERRGLAAAQEAKRTYDTTIQDMLKEIRNDPVARGTDAERAAELLAREFKENVWTRQWTLGEVHDNPLVRELSNISIWSTYRKRVGEFQAGKNKLGSETVDNGDGTFTGLVGGSFSQKTGTANVPGFMVARDEDGLLYITDVDTWINGKMADMQADPGLAARTIGALSSIQAYGQDSAANGAAASRVVTDSEGNPVKAFVSNEDYTALKNMALMAVNSQTGVGKDGSMDPSRGNPDPIDDFFAELTAQSQEIYNDPQWEPPSSGGGGGGGGGYRGGGGGYGGGGGGGSGAVRYTDPEQLKSFVDSIARQRMGRVLTTEEAQEFANYYHQMEAQMTAAYYAGQSTTQLDPESQAVAWIETKFNQERSAQSYGNMAATFMKMIGSGGFTGAFNVGGS